MPLGVLALVLAAAAAGWLLWRSAKGGAPAGEGRTVVIMKAVVFLGLAAALFAARLWPLAFMTLVAAGAVTGIELWRARRIEEDAAAGAGLAQPAKGAMRLDEAASVLGVSADASPDEIRAAHKRLIAQLHPDRGGTDYLAAKINDARETMLRARAPVAPPAED